VKEKPIIGFVEVLKNVIYTIGIETRSTTLEAMNFVAFCKKELGKVRTVLACAAGD
jgi:hypothetical protein